MSADAPASPRLHGAELDRLAALEEERRFLLRSLTDLEREHDAGDVDDLDYETLKDGYTARAADVLRRIEAGQARIAPRSRRRWTRTIVIVAAVLAVAVARRSGLSARATGSRAEWASADNPGNGTSSGRTARCG